MSASDEFQERFELTGGIDRARSAQEELLEAAKRRSYDDSSCFAVRLAMEEAISNAFYHGNGGDPQKCITLNCRVDPERIEIEVQDEGRGFDPDSVPDPTEEENLEIPSGRGIVLMRAYMTNVQFDPPGNRVRLTFLHPKPRQTG